jgi:hypothetical protein
MKFNSYLILSLLILSSGSIFNILGLNNLIVSIVFILIFIISIRTGVFKNKKNVTTLLFLVFLMAIVFIIHAANYGEFSSLYNNNNISMLLITITCALVCFFFNSKNTFLKYLNTILLVFILHGIISTLLISLLPTENVLITGLKETSKYVGYLNLFFQRIHINYLGHFDPTYISYFGFKLHRAHGLAWEPGNFSAYVNIFIFLNLFILKNKRNSIIGIIAMILAWSTAGLSIMLIQLFYYSISNINKYKVKFIIPKILIASIAIYAIVNATIFNYNEKISGDKSGSGAVRIVNTIRSLQAISNNPLIGTGLLWNNYVSELNRQLKSSKLASNKYVESDKVNLDSAFTNSYLKLFVQLGIPIGIILTIAIFKQTLIPKKKILFAIIIILSVSSAPLVYYPFFLLFIVSGILKMLGVKQLPNKHFQHNYDRNLKGINLKEKN